MMTGSNQSLGNVLIDRHYITKFRRDSTRAVAAVPMIVCPLHIYMDEGFHQTMLCTYLLLGFG